MLKIRLRISGNAMRPLRREVSSKNIRGMLRGFFAAVEDDSCHARDGTEHAGQSPRLRRRVVGICCIPVERRKFLHQRLRAPMMARSRCQQPSAGRLGVLLHARTEQKQHAQPVLRRDIAGLGLQRKRVLARIVDRDASCTRVRRALFKSGRARRDRSISSVVPDRVHGARLQAARVDGCCIFRWLVPCLYDWVIKATNLGAPGLDFETWESTNWRRQALGESRDLHCGRQFAWIALGAAWLVTGCALHRPVTVAQHPVGSSHAIDLQGTVASHANDDGVVDIDVVTIRNKSSLKEIEKMDAAAWFGPKGRCTYLGVPGDKVAFHSWQFAPGQSFYIHLVPGSSVKAVLAFADYPPPGPHRIVLAKSGAQSLELSSGGLSAHATKAFVPAGPTAPAIPNVCPDN